MGWLVRCIFDCFEMAVCGDTGGGIVGGSGWGGGGG